MQRRSSLKPTAARIKDLVKLAFGFKFEQIFTTPPAASKYDALFKSGKIGWKIIISIYYHLLIHDITLLIYSVVVLPDFFPGRKLMVKLKDWKKFLSESTEQQQQQQQQ